MTWNTPAFFTTGKRIRDTDWNQQIAENMAALDQHRHTGSPGDGAALAVPIPIPHQAPVNNTVALINVLTTIFGANPFGSNGTYLVYVTALFDNTTGGNRNLTLVGDLGGTTITLNTGAIASGAARHLYTGTFVIANKGATNVQILTAIMDGNPGGGGPVFDISAPAAIDTSIAGIQFKLGFQLTGGVASALLGFELVQGYIIGPSFSA